MTHTREEDVERVVDAVVARMTGPERPILNLREGIALAVQSALASLPPDDSLERRDDAATIATLYCKIASLERELARSQPPQAHDAGHPHLIGGEFQSDKYPSCPRGKVPLSCKDKTAQDLLWEYAQRRRAVDAEFADDLELTLVQQGYNQMRLAKPMHADQLGKVGFISAIPVSEPPQARAAMPEQAKPVCSAYHSRAVGMACQNCGHSYSEHVRVADTIAEAERMKP